MKKTNATDNTGRHAEMREDIARMLEDMTETELAEAKKYIAWIYCRKP